MASSQEKLLSVTLRMCVGEQKEYVDPHPGTRESMFLGNGSGKQNNLNNTTKTVLKKSAMAAAKTKHNLFLFFCSFIYRNKYKCIRLVYILSQPLLFSDLLVYLLLLLIYFLIFATMLMFLFVYFLYEDIYYAFAHILPFM